MHAVHIRSLAEVVCAFMCSTFYNNLERSVFLYLATATLTESIDLKNISERSMKVTQLKSCSEINSTYLDVQIRKFLPKIKSRFLFYSGQFLCP